MWLVSPSSNNSRSTCAIRGSRSTPALHINLKKYVCSSFQLIIDKGGVRGRQAQGHHHRSVRALRLGRRHFVTHDRCHAACLPTAIPSSTMSLSTRPSGIRHAFSSLGAFPWRRECTRPPGVLGHLTLDPCLVGRKPQQSCILVQRLDHSSCHQAVLKEQMERTKGTVEGTTTMDKFETTSVFDGVGAIKCSYSCARDRRDVVSHALLAPFVQLVRQRLAFVSLPEPLFRAFLHNQLFR